MKPDFAKRLFRACRSLHSRSGTPWWIAGVAFFGAIAGCGGDDEAALTALRSVARTVSQSAADTGTSQSADLDATRDAEPAASFAPPYPDRENAFVFPGTGEVESSVAAPVATVAEIQVLGFANIDRPRVLLRYKTLTKSLGVGEKIEGVEVIGIAPPKVELRMGSLVWNATMFDKSR